MLITAVPPDVDYVRPLYDPAYDPIWRTCEELEIDVHSHGGTGLPDYGKYAVANLLYIMEAASTRSARFVQLLLSGVFERFPDLKFVMTEQGCAWIPPMLKHMDRVIEQIRKTGRTGELAYSDEHKLPRACERVLRAELLRGCEPAGSRGRDRDADTRPRPRDVGERLPAR